ncbi:hypothetical protein TKK_0012262 [Trichogramma kaykai]
MMSDENDQVDLQFFETLLPLVKLIQPQHILQFRTEINLIVQSYAYTSDKEADEDNEIIDVEEHKPMIEMKQDNDKENLALTVAKLELEVARFKAMNTTTNDRHYQPYMPRHILDSPYRPYETPSQSSTYSNLQRSGASSRIRENPYWRMTPHQSRMHFNHGSSNSRNRDQCMTPHQSPMHFKHGSSNSSNRDQCMTPHQSPMHFKHGSSNSNNRDRGILTPSINFSSGSNRSRASKKNEKSPKSKSEESHDLEQ